MSIHVDVPLTDLYRTIHQCDLETGMAFGGEIGFWWKKEWGFEWSN